MRKINFKQSKNAYILCAIIFAISVVAIILLDRDASDKTTISTKEGKVNIVLSEVKKLELVDYENDSFTMKIPKGWSVNVGGTDMFYAIRVYDPKSSNNQIFAILKAQPFLKNDKAKSWYQSYYNSFGGVGNKMLAEAIVLSKPTVNDFYSSFNSYAVFAKNNDSSYSSFNFPDLRNFVSLESFESNSSMKSVSKDDKTLRGTFQNSKGENGEGLFMASIVDIGKNMTLGYDTMFYMAYNIMGISANKDEFVNYQKLLTESLNSLVYKESFTSNTIRNGQEQTKNALAINASIQEAFNSYNNAWTNRQKTYDITSQKYSDATLGYERVYNTETNEIYKAYNGFMDEYDGEKYKFITDDMYTSAIDGYIEK